MVSKFGPLENAKTSLKSVPRVIKSIRSDAAGVSKDQSAAENEANEGSALGSGSQPVSANQEDVRVSTAEKSTVAEIATTISTLLSATPQWIGYLQAGSVIYMACYMNRVIKKF